MLQIRLNGGDFQFSIFGCKLIDCPSSALRDSEKIAEIV